MSWGFHDQNGTFTDAMETGIMKISAMGISIVASSAESAMDRQVYSRSYPQLPARSPFVTAVGGTDFRDHSTIDDEIAFSGMTGFVLPKFQDPGRSGNSRK